MTIAVAVCEKPQDAYPCVAIFSHSTLHFTLHVPWGKALYFVRESCHRTVTIGSAAAVATAFPSGHGFEISYLKSRLSFGTLLCPALIEGVANRRDEFFVIERLHEKGDWPDGHCGGTRGQILSGGNDNYASPG